MGCFMKGVLFLRMYFLGCIIFEDVFFKGVFNLRVFIIMVVFVQMTI